LYPDQHRLLEDGRPVRLGSRALDILIVLVDQAGALIGKEELISRVWPDTLVDEGSLRVHVAALRRALGDAQAGNRYIANIHGRGYQFVAPVSRSSQLPDTPGVAPRAGSGETAREAARAGVPEPRAPAPAETSDRLPQAARDGPSRPRPMPDHEASPALLAPANRAQAPPGAAIAGELTPSAGTPGPAGEGVVMPGAAIPGPATEVPPHPGVVATRLPDAASQFNLPTSLTRMVGRAEFVDAVSAQLARRRFVTIVGPGGIGKTTVALAVADRLIGAWRDGVAFIDLAALADPRLVPSAVAAVLRLPIRSDDALRALVGFLGDRSMLLVLDGCERVIGAAAVLAEEVFRGAQAVSLLATSREPLRVEGERVHRLPPLGVPPVVDGLTAAAAAGYPAVQLFVERATSSVDSFVLTDANAPVVADICRRLDGIALAIELAAGRVDAFGVRGVADRLDDRFRLLTHGRRTALPRHQTLRAALDWSYEALPEPERLTLRRLAVFAGLFSLEAAHAIAGEAARAVAVADLAAADAAPVAAPDAATDVGAAAPEIIDVVANLVAKSLVAAEVGDTAVHYRLPETTRAYALQQLTESGELALLSRRHAEYFQRLMQRAAGEFATTSATEWLANYGRQIDNVRAALDWALAPGGDVTIGAALTVATVPLWVSLSLIEERRARVELAIAANARAAREPGGAEAGPGGSPDADLEADRRADRDMRLYAALGGALVSTRGIGPVLKAAWQRSFELAERLGDTDHQLRALWGLWLAHLHSGEHRAALAFAQRFQALAASAGEPADRPIGDRLVGYMQHILGELAAARMHTTRMLDRYIVPASRAHLIRFDFDQRVQARGTLAHLLWLQGLPDQAQRLAAENVEHARAIDHAVSLANGLLQSPCPVALLCGDLATTEHLMTELQDHAARHALGLWDEWVRCFVAVLCIRHGGVIAGAGALRTALAEIRDTRFLPRYAMLSGVLAEAQGEAGDSAAGLATIDGILARCEHLDERWCIPELLRIKAGIVLRAGAPEAATAAAALFRESFELAGQQGALSWQLRTATGLARLLVDQGRSREARDLLAEVYRQFREGFATADLIAAERLLDELA
jgi:predicted ATPase/DNA-binding winged helix-turn-helix (wHTH) protein